MSSVNLRLTQVQKQISEACTTYNREVGSVQLLAVSKTRPEAEILSACEAGQLLFGESYLQEALEKIGNISRNDIEWHFIGRIQSNKTRPIAEHFDWVHSLDNLKKARRLNDQRPDHLQPLKVCLQIKIDKEESKAGFSEPEAKALIAMADQMPRISIEGLMTLPAPSDTLEEQRRPFRQLKEMRDRLATTEIPLSTLSMGMSGDLEAAIAEGATMVRIGTAIFGPRNYPKSGK